MDNWIAEHTRLLVNDRKIEASKLRLSHIPERLFQFKPMYNKYAIDCLKSGIVWLSYFDDLNDPFECTIKANHASFIQGIMNRPDFKANYRSYTNEDMTEEQKAVILNSEDCVESLLALCNRIGIVTETPEMSKRMLQKIWNEEFQIVRKAYKISCFTERDDAVLMWSHYAEQHEGICIEYDLSEYKHKDSLFPVVYSQDLYEIKTHDGRDEECKAIMATTTKALDWQYECEWRLLVQPTKTKKLLSLPSPRVSAIYLGSRFNPKKKLGRKLLKLIATRNIPVYYMQLHPTEFKMIRDVD